MLYFAYTKVNTKSLKELQMYDKDSINLVMELILVTTHLRPIKERSSK